MPGLGLGSGLGHGHDRSTQNFREVVFLAGKGRFNLSVSHFVTNCFLLSHRFQHLCNICMLSIGCISHHIRYDDNNILKHAF